MYFATDVGDSGLLAAAPDETELEFMKRVQVRHLQRLDRHIVRLPELRNRL